jgi:hypothetical protein
VVDASGNWRLRLNRADGTRPYTTQQFGKAGDIPVSGDFNGDRRADWAVFRPNDGMLDINGDGKLDLVVSGWYVWMNIALGTSLTVPTSAPQNQVTPYDWGRRHGVPGDIPITGDFNNDGKSDYAVYRPVEPNHPGFDYTGDGKLDPLSSWYTYLNLGTDGQGKYIIQTYDWQRMHGTPSDTPVGRNPLMGATPLGAASVSAAAVGETASVRVAALPQAPSRLTTRTPARAVEQTPCLIPPPLDLTALVRRRKGRVR